MYGVRLFKMTCSSHTPPQISNIFLTVAKRFQLFSARICLTPYFDSFDTMLPRRLVGPLNWILLVIQALLFTAAWPTNPPGPKASHTP